jgi:pimeloyl-ACP methyl ester carboxylesterase
MPSPSIYRSARGEAELKRLYEQKLANLTVAANSCMVQTRFGHTHVLTVGPPEAPPVMVLTGISTGAPRTLEWFQPLAQDYRLHAPDPIGQPGRSAQTRVPPGADNYAKWLLDVLDGLELQQLPFVGISFGGGILLELATYAPERISRAALVAPMGLTRVPKLHATLKFFFPSLLYRFFPSRKRLIGTVRPVLGEADDFSLRVFDATLRHVKLNVSPPGPFAKKALAGFKAPTLLLLAKTDIFIPLKPALKRAQELLPSLVTTEVFEGPHIPSGATWRKHAVRIKTFFNENR